MRTYRPLIVLALFGGLVLACGGDDDDSSEPAGTEAEATTAAGGAETTAAAATSEAGETTEATDTTEAAAETTEASEDTEAAAPPEGEPIRLMVIREGDGTPANTPAVLEGAQAAAEAINGRGGIQGRPVEIVDCNTRADPNGASECARQAASEAVAVVGMLSSLEASVLPILAESSIPNIGVIPVSTEALMSPTAFPLNGGAPTRVIGTARAIVDQGAQHLAVIHLDNPNAAAFVPLINEGIADTGITVENTVSVPIGAPDVSSYVASALEGDIDGVALFLLTPDMVKVVQAIEASGNRDAYTVAAVTSEAERLVEALAGGGEGLISVASNLLPSQTDVEQIAQYDEEMEAIGALPSERGVNSWASVYLFEQAAADLATIDSASILDALSNMDNFDSGVYAPMDFTTPVDAIPGLTRLFNPTQQYIHVEGGTWQPLNGGGFVNVFNGEMVE